MKLLTVFGLIAAFFTQSVLTLEKTQQEAHKFLIDGGQVSAHSVVQSFTLDRNGQIRIRVTDKDYTLSFGLEQEQDTYGISFMNKKKKVTPTIKAGSGTENDQITKVIGQTFSILKGGKVVKVHRPTTGRVDLVIEYKLGTKTYTVTGYQNKKTGSFGITKIEDGAPKIAAEL